MTAHRIHTNPRPADYRSGPYLPMRPAGEPSLAAGVALLTSGLAMIACLLAALS